MTGGVKEEENNARVGGRNHLFHVRARGRVAGRDAKEGGGAVDKRAEPRDSGEGREGGEAREGGRTGGEEGLDDVLDDGGAADDDIYCIEVKGGGVRDRRIIDPSIFTLPAYVCSLLPSLPPSLLPSSPGSNASTTWSTASSVASCTTPCNACLSFVIIILLMLLLLLLTPAATGTLASGPVRGGGEGANPAAATDAVCV